MRLTKDMVAQTHTGTPEHLAMYASDVAGPAAIGIGAKMCVLHGCKVRFAACKKEGGEDPQVMEIVEFGTVPGRKVVRCCGEEGSAEGAGSHTLYGSMDIHGNPAEMDVAEVAAAMMWTLARIEGANSFFRLA